MNYSIFTQNPHITVYCLILFIAVSGLWTGASKIAQILLLTASVLAFALHYLTGIGAIILSGMIALIYQYYRLNYTPLISYQKIIVGILITVFAPLIYMHWAPGFNNLLLINNLQLSPDALPYRLYINADKIFIGSAILLYGYQRKHLLTCSIKDWVEVLKPLPLPLLAIAFILIGSSFALHYVRLDMKFPAIIWLWAPANLLFVCAIEEALFRGFIQKELAHTFLHLGISYGPITSILVGALLFGLTHYTGGPIYILLSTLAGIGYGYVFSKSNRIESSIVLHFLVNLIHFLNFSYPALRPIP